MSYVKTEGRLEFIAESRSESEKKGIVSPDSGNFVLASRWTTDFEYSCRESEKKAMLKLRKTAKIWIYSKIVE